MHASSLILGAGQDGGSPQLGHRSGTGADRSASSVAVVTPYDTVILLDASPDLRMQSLALLAWDEYPRERTKLVDMVAVTHAHMGHYAGLLQFGREAANVHGLPLAATRSFHRFLRDNDPWAALIADAHLEPVDISTPIVVDDATVLVGVPVPHRAEYTDTVAVSVRINDEPWLCYLPDIDDWDDWPQAESVIAEHRTVLVDATFSEPDEVPGRNITGIAHPFVSDTIGRFAHLTTTSRIVLGHINHSNRLADPTSAIAVEAAELGFLVAYDGMDISG